MAPIEPEMHKAEPPRSLEELPADRAIPAEIAEIAPIPAPEPEIAPSEAPAAPLPAQSVEVGTLGPPAEAVIRWRPQPHGGQLKTGGVHPGAGRPREAVRLKALEILERQLDWIERMADGTELEDVRIPMVGIVKAQPTAQTRLYAASLLKDITRVAQPDPKGSKGGRRLILQWEDPPAMAERRQA